MFDKDTKEVRILSLENNRISRKLIIEQVFVRKIVRKDRKNRETMAIDILYKGDQSHQNLVTLRGDLYKNDFRNDRFYIDMERCDFSLEQYLSNQQSTFSSKNLREFSEFSCSKGDWNIWDIIAQISGGIEFIHNRELVHRDLKPTNGIPRRIVVDVEVLFSEGDGCWKITDFGLTTWGTSTEAEPCPEGNGSTGYRAPEIILRKPFTNTVDIWALGCILFEVAKNGRKAFQSDFRIRDYATTLPPSLESILDLTDLDQQLCGLLKRMLQVAGSERPPAAIVRPEFEAGLWRNIGDALRNEGKINGSIKAYEKGLLHHRTCGLLCQRLEEAKEADVQFQVFPLCHIPELTIQFAQKASEIDRLSREIDEDKQVLLSFQAQLCAAQEKAAALEKEVQALGATHAIELSNRDKRHATILDDRLQSIRTRHANEISKLIANHQESIDLFKDAKRQEIAKIEEAKREEIAELEAANAGKLSEMQAALQEYGSQFESLEVANRQAIQAACAELQRMNESEITKLNARVSDLTSQLRVRNELSARIKICQQMYEAGREASKRDFENARESKIAELDGAHRQKLRELEQEKKTVTKQIADCQEAYETSHRDRWYQFLGKHIGPSPADAFLADSETQRRYQEKEDQLQKLRKTEQLISETNLNAAHEANLRLMRKDSFEVVKASELLSRNEVFQAELLELLSSSEDKSGSSSLA